MFAMTKLQVKFGSSRWRAAICLVLGVFFLYNPFVTICIGSGPSPVFHHPVSYRSTIASSELGCGTVQHAKVHVAPLQVLLIPQRNLLQQEDAVWPKPADETVRAVTQDIASSLWFRPPPIA
jgi:hypothetical protein